MMAFGNVEAKRPINALEDFFHVSYLMLFEIFYYYISEKLRHDISRESPADSHEKAIKPHCL